MTFVTVFPPTTRVSDQHGPWPGSPGCAQWHVGLPQARYRLTSAPGRSSPMVASAAWISSHRRSNSAKVVLAAILHLLSDSHYGCQTYNRMASYHQLLSQ